MWENDEQNLYYVGVFNVLDEQISGQIVYNKKNGLIMLNLIKELKEKSIFGRSYGTIEVITGRLNSGATVTLFNNRCANNHTQAFQAQQLNFVADYMIWANEERVESKYNKMVCILKNAYEWSGLSAFEEQDLAVKVKEEPEIKTYNWFGAKISFSTYLNNWLFVPSRNEETTIIQRLILEIEVEGKSDINELISVRNKIISLISFAIKNNVNIEEEYLYDYDETYVIANDLTDFRKYYLITSDIQRDTLGTRRWEYNFKLEQLPDNNDINNQLIKLEPIFNLYLSLFKYRDMPQEMIFLNIVQALETFHSRFFYDDKKKKYIESVTERFGAAKNFEKYEKLLLSDTQKDENCNYIILVSRLNDLLIGKDDGLFWEYYWEDDEYAQKIADTRHYYTHYGKSKEKKALKGEDLAEAIFVLRVLLEYHICLVLGIDNRQQITHELGNHYAWRQLSESQSQKTKNSIKALD